MIKKLGKLDTWGEWLEKLNEVIDAVNELQESQNTYWTDIAEIKKELQTRAENVQPDAESRQENVQDVDELEQAEKWVGKLCWFSQLYGCRQHIAILKRISESGLYVTDDGELHYAYCEPVKPDDDIIYKTEQKDN